MPREGLEEPVEAWCELCASRGKRPGEGDCEECRPLRVRFLSEIVSRRPGQRIRVALHRLTGLDVGGNVFGAAAIGVLLVVALLLLTLGG